ncbi:MAG: M48 family metallopeptidase [Lachnospiraceae bacterium]|nr:M48 family metallopeptidase [Lachnospiraceae bacterium]
MNQNIFKRRAGSEQARLSSHSIPYQLIRSRRKTIAIQIRPDGAVVVRAPLRASLSEIDHFIREKESWIRKHVEIMQAKKALDKSHEIAPLTDEQLRHLTRRARLVFTERVEYFAPLVGTDYGRISIRHQRTRWGSCSAAGNLNFNCLLLLAPPQVLDYVVVHELCHRLELNHSARFWGNVERVMPDYRIWNRWLKENGRQLMQCLEQ